MRTIWKLAVPAAMAVLVLAGCKDDQSADSTSGGSGGSSSSKQNGGSSGGGSSDRTVDINNTSWYRLDDGHVTQLTLYAEGGGFVDQTKGDGQDCKLSRSGYQIQAFDGSTSESQGNKPCPLYYGANGKIPSEATLKPQKDGTLTVTWKDGTDDTYHQLPKALWQKNLAGLSESDINERLADVG